MAKARTPTFLVKVGHGQCASRCSRPVRLGARPPFAMYAGRTSVGNHVRPSSRSASFFCSLTTLPPPCTHPRSCPSYVKTAVKNTVAFPIVSQGIMVFPPHTPPFLRVPNSWQMVPRHSFELLKMKREKQRVFCKHEKGAIRVGTLDRPPPPPLHSPPGTWGDRRALRGGCPRGLQHLGFDHAGARGGVCAPACGMSVASSPRSILGPLAGAMDSDRSAASPLSQVVRVLASQQMNLLLLAIPPAFVCSYMHFQPAWTFAAAFLSLVPLAALLGDITEVATTACQGLCQGLAKGLSRACQGLVKGLSRAMLRACSAHRDIVPCTVWFCWHGGFPNPRL